MFNNFFNDPIIKQLSDAYIDILKEDHTKEELMELDVDELRALMSEYSDKVEMAKDPEEAEKNKKELQMIRDILASKQNKSEE
jgi:hypothetical protein